jgi:dual specificity tyrosine-phosphorylation-regulated kinase 2/3/4
MNNIYNEIEILKSLKKKEENNITKIFEYFFFRKDLYIVLKLYNITLHEYIYNHKNNRVDLNLNYIKQLTKSIDFLNKNNIIHGDIKPNNIVFKDSSLETIILIDFGNSCFSNNIDYRTSHKIQTIYYRAPEIIINNLCNTKIEYNYKIDVWSLGCIIYELFYKKRLFDSGKNLELFVNYNIIFDHPKISLLKKLKELHKYYDDIDYPSYIKLNNVIYGFKKKNFIKKHQDKPDIIELVLRCCEWDMEDRINCDQILKYVNDSSK